jgi:deoxyuridine 5'-triphosphate nucleotidohydrolase
MFKVVRTSPLSKLPVRATSGAAGYDISSIIDIVVPARGKALVNTGLQICVPNGTYGRIAPRSGLASKHFIDVGAGVIDACYTGEVLVLLFNHSDIDFKVSVGDRIAQLILESIVCPAVTEVTKLVITDRGSEGFGSTGA